MIVGAIRSSLAEINVDLYQAVVYYEMSLLRAPRWFDVPREASPGFSAIREALEREIVLAICRLWDTNKKAARIPAIANQLKIPAVLAELQAHAENIVNRSDLA